MQTHMARTLAGAMLACWLPTVALADSSPADQAAAQELFDQGRRLADEGRYAEACAKFEASQRLDPGAGTLLNLATCNQRIGKVATAWTQFNEALSLAIRDGRRDRISFAREHIAVVEPQLPRLTVHVRSQDIEGVSISIDGAPLGKAAWGVAAPIDPGNHVVAASAPGRLPFKTAVELAAAETKSVDVPALAADPNAAAKTEEPTSIEQTTSPVRANPARRIAGEIAIGAGVLALGAGAYFGVRTMSIWSDANANCPNDMCSQRGEQLTQDARSAARAADVAIGIGIAALGAGAVLILTSAGASSSPAKLGVAFVQAARGGGLVLDGAW
jgi:hypothetical protein